MTADKVLPKDSDSDYSLPGRSEESNPQYSESIPDTPKSKGLWIGIIIFAIVSSGFFSYYFINQTEIDSQITQNTLNLTPEQILAKQYGVGKFGSEHTHAAMVVILDGSQLNFGLPQFQLSSKYIHFENHNPYLIHKHATGVPLAMLFASFGVEITQDCIMLNYDFSDTVEKFCTGEDQSLMIYLNGERYYSDISQYEINHNDRILISFGDESISKHLKYLESLKIFDVPKKTPNYSLDEIFI